MDVNFYFHNEVPDFDVVGMFLVEGRYGSLQCHFDYALGYDRAIKIRQNKEDMGTMKAVNIYFNESSSSLN